MRPLPEGMNLLPVTDPHALTLVHRAAEDAIVGYSAANAPLEDQRRARTLTRLFTGAEGAAPFNSRVIAVVDDTASSLYGAVIVEAFAPAELAEREPEVARTMARTHYVLAGMFVHSSARGQGIGTLLLHEASYQVASHQGRYLDGFVDQRNGSARFYARAGATMSGRNRGLPARPPSNVELQHPGGHDGNWFYVDCWQRHQNLMRCARCRGPLTFNPADGGDLECARCGRPPVDESQPPSLTPTDPRG